MNVQQTLEANTVYITANMSGDSQRPFYVELEKLLRKN